MHQIKENTVDFEAHIYDSAMNDNYRWSIRPDPDLPGSVNLSYNELAHYDNRSRQGYEQRGMVGFDKETWEKIKYAIDGVFEKTIRRFNERSL